MWLKEQHDRDSQGEQAAALQLPQTLLGKVSLEGNWDEGCSLWTSSDWVVVRLQLFLELGKLSTRISSESGVQCQVGACSHQSSTCGSLKFCRTTQSYVSDPRCVYPMISELGPAFLVLSITSLISNCFGFNPGCSRTKVFFCNKEMKSKEGLDQRDCPGGPASSFLMLVTCNETKVDAKKVVKVCLSSKPKWFFQVQGTWEITQVSEDQELMLEHRLRDSRSPDLSKGSNNIQRKL